MKPPHIHTLNNLRYRMERVDEAHELTQVPSPRSGSLQRLEQQLQLAMEVIAAAKKEFGDDY
jgi:hypothetical protein